VQVISTEVAWEVRESPGCFPAVITAWDAAVLDSDLIVNGLLTEPDKADLVALNEAVQWNWIRTKLLPSRPAERRLRRTRLVGSAIPRRTATSSVTRTEGVSMTDRPEILVMCTHNAGRSVAARVLLDHYGRGRLVVRSAGSAPGDVINPVVAQILADRGLDVSKEFPKPLTDEVARSADVIITMGCGDACPVYPGKRYLDWDLADPTDKGIDEVVQIVDEIDRRARDLVDELLTP
jgi:protein-tyrosine-phosphatase